MRRVLKSLACGLCVDCLWTVCGHSNAYVLGVWTLCGSFCGRCVDGLWTHMWMACGRTVDVPWTLCGRFVDSAVDVPWTLCGRVLFCSVSFLLMFKLVCFSSVVFSMKNTFSEN